MDGSLECVESGCGRKKNESGCVRMKEKGRRDGERKGFKYTGPQATGWRNLYGKC